MNYLKRSISLNHNGQARLPAGIQPFGKKALPQAQHKVRTRAPARQTLPPSVKRQFKT